MKALVFEPHDDDLVIGMGGTALKMMKNSWKFKTVQMTDGRHGSNQISPEELVDIRHNEKKAELEFLGIECEFLDYEDGSLWNLMQEDRKEVISRLVELINEFEPDAVFIPARSEGHPDHRATSLLAGRAVYESNIDPLKVSYLVWDPPFLEGENLAEKIIRVGVEDEYEDKLEALRKHKSQLDEGGYDKMIKHFNQYLGFLYSSYKDKKPVSEVLGIQNPEKLDRIGIDYGDVTNLSHGRSSEDISL